jgi:hypothetical protein
MSSFRRFWLGLGIALVVFNSAIGAQSLADLAREQREKREREKAKRVYTNEDLNKYETTRNASPAPSPSATPAVSTSEKSQPFQDMSADERVWSRRFIEARTRVEETKAQGEALQAKLTDLNLKLLRQSDIYDREHVYNPLIAQTRQQIEQNKADTAAAEQAFEDLREELRKSGKPASWENSQLALKPEPKDGEPDEPKTKDQGYWQEKLAAIDKRYDAIIGPLETERFQLLHRRDPKDGEASASAGSLGLGAPPRVIDIDVQIKELNQKRAQEKQALVEQAVREGALPGWFR